MAEGFQPAGRAPAPPPLDLAQDFVNTEIPEWARDDIASPEALAAWLRGRGLLDEAEDVTAHDFVAARELRIGLRQLALCNTLGVPPDEAARDRLAGALSGFALAAGVADDGRVLLEPAGVGARRALAAIVAVVLTAEAAGTWRRMKACRKDTCGWLFFDASRNGSSSWCSMSICGNRTKAAQYRRRRSTA
jgi:predicted RNA-binding Zn ribbon-like protein